MVADITIHHTSITQHMDMLVTILTPRHTAEAIMERRTTTRRQALMAGRRLPQAHTDRQREGPHITRTLVPPREELPCRRRMAVEVRHRLIIRTPELML